MGQKISYKRVCRFPEENIQEDERSICRLWEQMKQTGKTVAKTLFALAEIAFFFHSLILLFWNKAITLEDIEKALKNCTETKAKESDGLHIQLVTANQSLKEIYQCWDTCQKELSTLNNSIRNQTKQQEAEKPHHQGRQAERQNQIAQAAVKKSMEELNKDLDVARKDGDDLNAQLLSANQNLDKTPQHWDACQKELQIPSCQKHPHDQSQTVSKMKNKMELEPGTSSGAITHVSLLTLLPLLVLLFL